VRGARAWLEDYRRYGSGPNPEGASVRANEKEYLCGNSRLSAGTAAPVVEAGRELLKEAKGLK
jgi:hypothetical protein